MSGTTDCGCCEGVTTETPVGKTNPPGQQAIGYRAGTWSTFRGTILSRLPSSDYPALAPLTTRSNDDYTIALCDAFAMMADVLTFYQERIANENYLRTATQRNSVVQLANLIGYQPSPGVAASVSLAFTLQSAPGSPTQATQPSVVPVGTQAQSVPDPGQSAQTFETIGAITARVEWNAIPAQINVPYGPAQGLSDLYLSGTTTQLNPGDPIVIVGGERTTDAASSRWDVRWLESVTTDTTNNLTHITWAPPLGATWTTPTAYGAQVFALRQRATQFGANAPDPRLMNVTNHQLVHHDGTWRHYHIDTTGQAVDLDSAYSKIVQGTWVVLANAVSRTIQLYNAIAVTQLSRTDFGLSGKITRLSFDTTAELGSFTLPETQVLAQSDLLALAPRRLPYPVYGSTLVLGVADNNIVPGQLLGVSGKLQRVMIGPETTGITFANDPNRPTAAGDSFLMLAAPTQTVGGTTQALTPDQLDPNQTPPLTGNLVWTLQDRNGQTVTVTAPAGSLQLQPALTTDPTVSEAAAIVAGADGIVLGLDATTLSLSAPLANCYGRSTVAVNANVAPATVGQTTAEVGGSGDASQQNQSFTLKKSPLTYVLDPNDPTGRSSTLTAAVNGLTWTEVPTLYGAGPTDRVCALSQANDGTSTVQFGDGVQRCAAANRAEQCPLRLPSGSGRGRQSARQPDLVAADPAAGRYRRDQSGQVHRRAGSGKHRRRPRQCAAPRHNAGSGGVNGGLCGLRRDVCRDCQGLRGLDQCRAVPRCLCHRRRAGRRDVPADRRDDRRADEIPAAVRRRAAAVAGAVLRQPDLHAVSDGQSRRRRRFADRHSGGHHGAASWVWVRRAEFRPAGDDRRRLRGDPGRHRCRRGRYLPALPGFHRPVRLGTAASAAGRFAGGAGRWQRQSRGAADPRSRSDHLGDHDMTVSPSALFNLLPAILRIRDAASQVVTPGLLTPDDRTSLADLLAKQSAGPLSAADAQALAQLQRRAMAGPLASLLAVLTEQVAVLQEDLDQLNDDQFIETCADWVAPYIGDLIGYQPLHGVTPAIASPRAEVAHTIGYRRRKGTITVLEQLARDVTGWNATAVEFFQRLVVTQYMNHVRPQCLASPDFRRWEPLERVGTAFDRIMRSIEVRRIENAQPLQHPQYRDLLVDPWSLQPEPFTRCQYRCAALALPAAGYRHAAIHRAANRDAGDAAFDTAERAGADQPAGAQRTDRRLLHRR